MPWRLLQSTYWRNWMRWTPGGVSGNIEDERDSGGGGGFSFGGGGGVGIGGLILAGILSLIFGRDFITPLFSGGGGAPAANRQVDQQRDRAEEPRVQFVS